MFTWNAPSVVLDKTSAEPSAAELTIANVVEMLGVHPKYCAVWKEFLIFLFKKRQQRDIVKSVSASMELCTATLKDKGELDCIFMLLFDFTKIVELRCIDSWKVCGSMPFNTNEAVSAKRFRNIEQRAIGHYYIACPKIGKVFVSLDEEPFVAYQSKPEWVTRLVQQNKITFDDAADEYIRCVRNAKTNHDNLTFVKRQQRTRALMGHVTKVQTYLAGKRFPRQWFPEIEETWLGEQKHIQKRQRFLVLDGASKLGTTMYAMSLVPDNAALELNCANCIEPDMSDYDERVHKLVLFLRGVLQDGFAPQEIVSVS